MPDGTGAVSTPRPNMLGAGDVRIVGTGAVTTAAPTLRGTNLVITGTGTVETAATTVLAFGESRQPDVAPTTWTIRRVRRSPHLAADDQWVFHTRFELVLEAGMGRISGQGADPQLMLRWSDDGGHTWSDEHWTSAGQIGEYRRRAIWRRLGRSRKRIYEVVQQAPVKTAWIGAYLDAAGGAH